MQWFHSSTSFFLTRWLRYLIDYGLCLLKDIPTNHGEIKTVTINQKFAGTIVHNMIVLLCSVKLKQLVTTTKLV